MLQDELDKMELLDSTQAAEYIGVKPASMRSPTSRFKKLGVKIGQYWFWKKADLNELKETICPECQANGLLKFTRHNPKYDIVSGFEGSWKFYNCPHCRYEYLRVNGGEMQLYNTA